MTVTFTDEPVPGRVPEYPRLLSLVDELVRGAGPDEFFQHMFVEYLDDVLTSAQMADRVGQIIMDAVGVILSASTAAVIETIRPLPYTVDELNAELRKFVRNLTEFEAVRRRPGA